MIRTRLQAITPALAVVTLVAVAASIAGLIVTGLLHPAAPDGRPAHGDLDTYAEVIAAMQAGIPYYEALHEALLRHGYGTLSVFNWRPPAFMSTLAALPSLFWAQAFLCALCGAAILTTVRFVAVAAGELSALFAFGLLLISLAAALATDAALMCELYAGALVLFSAANYGLGRWRLGFAAGFVALLFRELVAPYALICLVLALRDGRRSEAWAWLAALAAYGVYFGWHVLNVLPLLGAEDRAGPGWFAFGGTTFVLLTAAFNGLFLVLPYWLSGLLLPLSVLGLVAWRDPARDRLLATVLVYLVLFAFVGRTVNSYWGALYSPLLAPGLVFAPAAVRDLLGTLARPPAVGVARPAR